MKNRDINLQDTNEPNRNDDVTNNEHQSYRRVSAKRGSVWLTQAYQLFTASPGAWFAIVIFILILFVLPLLKHIAPLLMPVAIGGLMIGCHQASKKSPFKFDHLFAGLKSDGKELLILSAIYALGSLIIMLLTFYIMLLFGIDYQEIMLEIMPKNTNQMTEAQIIEWVNSLDPNKLQLLLLCMLVFMALMIPLFMAFWFAPALIVLQKMSATNSLKISFSACKNNFMAFLFYGLAAFGYLMLFFFVLSILTMLIPVIGILFRIVGFLAIFAISLSSIYTAYIDIFGESDDSNPPNNEENNSDSSMLA